MAINLDASFATVVHDSPPRARVESAFATVVHDSPPRARVEASFATVVHGGPLPPPPPPPVFSRRSRLRMLVEGVAPPPPPYTNQARVRPLSLDRQVGYGTGSFEFDALFSAAGSLLSGATATVDLSTDSDAFGVALDLSDAALLLVSCDEGSSGTLLLRASASGGWTSFLGTAAEVRVGPGNTLLLLAMEPGALSVSAGDSALEVEATGGSATYTIVVWGRR